MLSRVPPEVSSIPKQHTQGDKRPVTQVHSDNALRRRHSLCALASACTTTLSPTRATVPGGLILDRPTCQSASEVKGVRGWANQLELPILRSQYVARDVRVLSGSRWRLHRFQERTIVLRTGAVPTLSIFATASSFDTNCLEEIRPETTYLLPLDAACELTGFSVSSRRRQGVNTFTANSVQLSSLTATPRASALRLRIRFATGADSMIWCSLLRETLAHARWSRDTLPLKQKHQTQPRNVRLVQHVRSSQRFVVKVLAADCKTNDGSDYHELQILRRLHSASSAHSMSLVRGYRVVETPREMILVMPQLPGITLLQLLRQRQRRHPHLNDEESRRLLIQLAKLLQAVHQSGIVHCDINLENVLVTSDISRAWIIDFGGAYNLLDGHSSAHQEQRMTGTPGFIAPERIRYPLTPPTPLADVFSLGVLLFQVLTGQHPYHEALCEQRALKLADSLSLNWDRAKSLLLEKDVQPEMRGLLKKMLSDDPRTRISVDSVLEVAISSE